MENNKEVLLSISNLKQYFPLKKGRFVKANDGVSLDIYRGETFGLVGESGCGKSTLGRTILQLYHQTYGRTMYYGKSLDDIAPKYVEQTIKNLVKLRNEWKNLEQKKAKIEEEYAALSETAKVTVDLISDEIMEQILTELDGTTMVGITLLGTNGISVEGTSEGNVLFINEDGDSYRGELVKLGEDNVAWQYDVTLIPEPTTTTLSLLALCGLAARRRRK